MCSIALAAAAFMVLVTVLSIAGLALYMGALRTDVPPQMLTFSCSAKILRGDRFVSHLQEKSRKYKQQLENLYQKSNIGPALVSVIVDRFGEDAATIYFRLSINRKKLSRISNLEKTLRDVLLNDSISRRPIFRNIRFDPRSVQIRQLLESDNSLQRVISKPKNSSKPRSGVLLKPNIKPNLTLTADLPVKRKPTVEEIDFKEEDLPVIQGSFHISKTEADITEKKNAHKNDSTTNRPKTTHKTKPTAKETAVTSSLYKIAIVEKTSKTTPKRGTITSVTKITSTSPKSLVTTDTPTSKVSYTIKPFLFTIPAHSLDKEPWVPIQKEIEFPTTRPKKPANLEANPTVSLIELVHQRQPIYTSFTNPGLSFHPSNTETLGSTSMVGHPIPVNKIEITESSVTTQNTIPEIVTEASIIENRETIDVVDVNPTEDQSEVFVEVETLKHVPGTLEHNLDEDKIHPAGSNWELLNGTVGGLLYNKSDNLPDKIYNNTLRAVITRDHDPNLDLKLKQVTALKNLSSIFQNLASSLGIIKPTTDNPYLTVYQDTEPMADENTEESAIGEGHAEVIDADEESLMLETQPSTKLPLVTLIPVKSNSGVGRPLRPRPNRPNNITDVVENRSFPSDPFYKNLNIDIPKNSFKFVQTEVVTSVSTEINKIRINKNHLNDFKILGVLSFESDPYHIETTTPSYLDNETNEKLLNDPELIRNPKMDPKENFTLNQDEISIFSVNSSVSSTKNEKFQAGFNVLTEDKLKQLSEISKLNGNASNNEKETVISNKAISASYTVNQAGFKILTKTFNKIPFSKDEEKKSILGYNIISLNIAPNKTECSNFTVKCGDGQCLPDTTRCNQLLDCNDGADEKNCNCADYLKSQYLLRKICDGVVDCWDFSDENLCEWCKPDQYVCANSKFCIDKNRICDGIRDCPNGDDERQCVTVSPNMQAADQFPYYSDGYLMVRKHGRWGKLCMQNFEQVITKIRPPWQISDLGQAVCKAMTYQKLSTINVIVEPKFVSFLKPTNNERYYELSYTTLNITKSNLVFKESSCDNGEVVKLKCQTLECGTRPQAVNQLARRMYRIVGGGNAGLGAWPWQAALYKEGEFQCGATLLSDRWLLSAGHCFFHSLEEHWVARLGALRRGTALPSPYEQLRPIIRIVLHPGYFDAGFINDISLLKMEAPIVFSDYVRPICLPPPGTSLKDGRICTVIGWGQLFEVGRIFPDTLQEVQVPVISTAECRKRTLFLPLYKVTDDMFCAGYDRGGRDACLGDSGGPLMCSEPDGHWVLQGITSNGYGCARANRPGVYTKVANYVTWIESYIYDTSSIMDSGSIIKTTCPGHRCPLGECLPKSRLCNGFIECSDGSDEKDCSNV